MNCEKLCSLYSTHFRKPNRGTLLYGQSMQKYATSFIPPDNHYKHLELGWQGIYFILLKALLAFSFML